MFLIFSYYENSLDRFVYIIFYGIGARISTLMSIPDGLGPYFFRRKMEKTRPMREEMDGKVFISHQSRHFFWNIMIEVPFPICTLTWRVNNHVYRQIKGINRRNESTILLWTILLLAAVHKILMILLTVLDSS